MHLACIIGELQSNLQNSTYMIHNVPLAIYSINNLCLQAKGLLYSVYKAILICLTGS